MNLMAVPLAVMLLLALSELMLRRYLRGEEPPWREFAFNLGSGHLAMWFLHGVEIAAYAFVLRYASLHWVADWPLVAAWLLAFVGWDFCFYWMHRLHHKFPLLWAVHVVHHQGEHYNLSLGIRNSWYSSLTDLPFIIGLAVIGVPLPVFIVVSSMHYGIQFYNHNGLLGEFGWLRRFVVTPSYHRIHHAMAPVYRNRNFGGTFVFWDKLFGTYQVHVPGVPLRYGVACGPGRDNPLVANHVPFVRGKAWKAAGGGSGSSAPLQPLLVGVGAIALFLVVIVFIVSGQGGPNMQAWGSFVLIVLATGALGGMAEGRDWAFPGWLVLAIGLWGLAVAGLAGADQGVNLHYILDMTATTILLGHGLLVGAGGYRAVPDEADTALQKSGNGQSRTT